MAGPDREAIVVLDSDPIMEFWSSEVDEFRTTLRATGAFSSVDSRTLVTGPGNEVSVLREQADLGAGPAGPAGPRAIFLVTYGRSVAWRQGFVFGLLAGWARGGLIAVVNLLPQQHWHDLGLQIPEVVWAATGRSLPTAARKWQVASLDLRSAEDRQADARRIAVPMLERGAHWIDRWIRMAVDADDVVSLPALLVSPGDIPEPSAPLLSAPALVARFRAGASPQAFTLATRLAAAPINLRMLRALQRTTLRSGPAHLTEVLTSELVRPVRHRGADGDTRIVYEFIHGVREQLLSLAYRDRTIEVQHVVESELAHDVEAVRNLTLRVKDPRRASYPRANPAALPYMRIELAVHQALGGPNLSAAQRLSKAFGLSTPPQKRLLPPRGASTVTFVESRMSELRQSEDLADPPGSDEPLWGLGDDREGTGVPPIDSLRTAPRRGPRLPAVVGNLPMRNANFTGRRELLDALHEQLRAGTTAVLPEAVHGAGGVGKSQLVIEYVYLHQQDFDLIWWIPAERSAQIQSALVELAGRMGLAVPATANTAVPAVLEALRLGRPYLNWLLVFDNAENPGDVERFFPKGGPGSIVVTSRNQNWSGIATTLPVDVFDRQESIELMRRRDPALAVAQADRLAEVLGDLPLAIEAAAAWRAEMDMSAADYVTSLEESRPELGEEPPAGELDYPATVAAVWNISLSGLRDLDPLALRLLQLCAFFAPEPISRVLLSKPRGLRIDPQLDPLMRNASRLDQAILTIGRLALARIDHRTNSFQMHRLVQRVLIHQMDSDTRDAMRHSAHLLLAGNDPDQPDESEHWTRYAELYPHIVASHAERCLDDLVRETILNETRYLWRWGDHVEARNLAERAHTAWLEMEAEDHPDSLRMAYWLGFLHFVVGDYAAAAPLNARTLELYRSTLGNDAEPTLRAIGAVASDHRVAGDFAGALTLSQTVYENAAKSGDSLPFTLESAHNLAVSMRLSGLFGRALQLDEQTYSRLVQIYGTDHPQSLNTYAGINLDRRELGDYIASHVNQENVVATARRVLRHEDHPDLLRYSYWLTSSRRKAGKHQEALDLSSDVFRRFRNRYGHRHPETLLALLTVSIDQRVTGDLAAARETGETALDGLRVLYGESHPHTAGAQCDLAITLRLLDRFEMARDLSDLAVTVLTDRLTESHPLTLAARINLASDLFELGDFEAAADMDLESFERCTRLLGSSHPTTLASGVNLAMDLRGLGRDSEASALHEDTMERFRSTLGPEHPATAAAAAGVRANCDIDPLPL